MVQTTAVATGTMPLAAGFVGILPALTLLSEERDGSAPIFLSWWAAVGWSFSVAFFGCAIYFLRRPISQLKTEFSYHPRSGSKWCVFNDSPANCINIGLDYRRKATFSIRHCNSSTNIRATQTTTPSDNCTTPAGLPATGRRRRHRKAECRRRSTFRGCRRRRRQRR